MKYKLFILLLAWQIVGHAGVKFAGNKNTADKKQITKAAQTKKVARMKDVIRQLEIEGYANSVYVRVVIEITNDKQIVGHLYPENGVAKYVHGEKLEGVLHLYGEEGEHFTVIVP